MKKKRIILITLGIIIVLTIGHFALSKPVYTLGAKLYLANKYSWNIKDIETIEYFKANTSYAIDFESGSRWQYMNPSFIFKYKGREFTVEYMKHGYNSYFPKSRPHYSDDYQLEDIFQWCTEYLQENIDKDIEGVEVYSDIIYHSTEWRFDYKLPWDNRKVFNKNDAKELLDILNEAGYITVFYKTDDLNNYGTPPKEKGFHLYASNEQFSKFIVNKKSLFEQANINYNIQFVIINREAVFAYGNRGIEKMAVQKYYSINGEENDYIY